MAVSKKTPAEGSDAPVRYVISHRRAHLKGDAERKASRDKFADLVGKTFKNALPVKLKAAADGKPEEEEGRLVCVIEAAAKEMMEKAGKLGEDAIVEPEAPRTTQALRNAVLARALKAASVANTTAGEAVAPGTGAVLSLYLRRVLAPLQGVRVSVTFSGTSGQSVTSEATSDAQGLVTLNYNPLTWYAASAEITPDGRGWTAVIYYPQNGQVIQVYELPKSGPQAWWRGFVGSAKYDETAGKGIRLGVVDTGVGPHPYLSHVTGIGSCIDGVFTAGAKAAADVEQHGTHVCGIIGARPPENSGEFGGVAPGAALNVIRVVNETTGTASQADIAMAIDHLVDEEEVDLINISLGGTASAIEMDAVLCAYMKGTLCICAAGNEYGQRAMAPSSYPMSVAVSAMGAVGTSPQTNLAYLTQPQASDHYVFGGGTLYLASYSNIGPAITVIAPGSAIISTIPANGDETAPYMDMCGTSMASPLTMAALAVMLSKDPVYKTLAHEEMKAKYALYVLESGALDLGLSASYEGKGLVRILS